MLSDRKGLNVPDVVVPMAALTETRTAPILPSRSSKRWTGLRCLSSSAPKIVAEARKKLIGGKAALLAKIEKPARARTAGRDYRAWPMA
jgi:pyruvate kinase